MQSHAESCTLRAYCLLARGMGHLEQSEKPEGFWYHQEEGKYGHMSS